MNKTLDRAFAKAALLPEPEQERLARELLGHLDQLAELRAEIDLGLADLDAGLCGPLDLDAMLLELNAEYKSRSGL